MGIFSFLSSHEVAGFIISMAGQSILISIIGLTLVKLLSKKFAPLRSLVCTSTISALGLLVIISVGVRLFNISIQQTTLPVAYEEDRSNNISFSDTYDKLPSAEIISVPQIQSPTVKPNMSSIISPRTSEPSSYPIHLSLPVIRFINILGLIWFIGVLFQISRLFYGLMVVKRFKRSLVNINEAAFCKTLNNISATLFRKSRRVPRLYRSSLIESPMAIGIIHPTIIIPEKLFTTLTENELKSILLHEMAHIYHHDQAMGMIKRIVIAFHWWNPLVYIIDKEHEQAREEVSDNYVLNELSPEDYSRCLMNLAEKVSLISNIPFAAGMAGRGFNLIKRVEQILSKKRRVAMGTKMHLKIIGFSICLVLTFGISSFHARIKAVYPNNGAKELQEPLQTINPVTITKEDHNLTQKNTPKPKAVDEPDKLQSIPNAGTMPQKELTGKQVQENKTPAMVMASVDLKAINKTEKRKDSVSVQSSDEPALIKDQADNKVLTPNENTEDPDLNSATVPDNPVMNTRPEDAANVSKKEDIDTAIAKLSRQIELNNSDAMLYLLRGNLYMDKQDYEQAINDYTKVIEITPENITAYNNRGLVYENMGKYDQAIKDFTKAIKIDPGNIYMYINRGNAYYTEHRYQKAISDYTRVIKIDPEFSLAYISRGIIYHQKVSLSKAIKDFSKALELNDRDTGTYLLRGNVYYSNREYRQAIDDYNKALEINPVLIIAYRNLGDVYVDMGELDKAILEYSKAIIASEEPDAYINRNFFSKEGQSFNPSIFYATTTRLLQINLYGDNSYSYRTRYRGMDTEDPWYSKRDIESLQRRVFLSINNSMAFEPIGSYISRGQVYIKKGQFDKAISDFSRVIEINPNNSIAYYHRAEAYRKMGNEVEYKNDLNMSSKYFYKSLPAEIEKVFKGGYWVDRRPVNDNEQKKNLVSPDRAWEDYIWRNSF